MNRILLLSLTVAVFISCIFTYADDKKKKGERSQLTSSITPGSNTNTRLNGTSLNGEALLLNGGLFKEGFEDLSFPPAGWQTVNVLGTNVWTRSTGQFLSGEASAFISYEFTGGEDWLITPQLLAASSDSVSFWLRKVFTTNYPPDSLIVRVSTTDSALASFTNIIFSIEVNSLPASAWAKYSAGLDAFAGQMVYIAFQHKNVDGNGVNLDDVAIGTPFDNDVAAVSIDIGNNLPLTLVAPMATFENAGLVTQTFPVTMTISPGGYTSTKTVTDLPYGGMTQVTFDDWDPSLPGSYTVTVQSELASDSLTSNDTLTKTVNVYEVFVNDGWSSQASLPGGRWGNALAFYNSGTVPNDTGFILVISGADAAFTITTLVERFNMVTGVWDAVAPISIGRLQISAVRIGRYVYVPGGYTTGFTPTSELSIYDILTNTWSTGAPLPSAVGDYAIGTYGDSLVYVIGGYSGTADLNNVQIYNVNTNTWSAGTAKPGTASAGLRGSIVDNKIVIVGGYSQILAGSLSDGYVGTINPSDPTLITWTPTTYPGGTAGRLASGTPIFTGDSFTRSGEQYIFFAGGDPDGGGVLTLTGVWGYNIQTDEWFVGPDMPVGVSNISNFLGVVKDDTIHMVNIGGYDGAAVANHNNWLKIGHVSVIPVELTSFTANVTKNRVTLSWSTSTENNNRGFEVEKSVDNKNFSRLGFIAGYGTTTEVKSYSFVDESPSAAKSFYRLKQIDFDGSFAYSNIVEVTGIIPDQFSVSQNYPNPFNPSTTIEYQVPAKNFVSIKVFDVLGNEVANLVNEQKEAGYYTVNFNASELSTGIYLYQVKAGTFSTTKKMILIK